MGFTPTSKGNQGHFYAREKHNFRRGSCPDMRRKIWELGVKRTFLILCIFTFFSSIHF